MSVTLISLGEETKYYSFAAKSLEEAKKKMKQLGPKDGDGDHSASCTVKADIMKDLKPGIVPGSVKQQAGIGYLASAKISQAKFRYGFIYMVPKWTNVGSLSKPVRTEWQRYLKALWTHERGHATAAMPVIRKFQKDFEKLVIAGVGTSSKAAEDTAKNELKAQAKSMYDLLADATDKAGKKYDTKTRHGRTQGAKLKTRPPRGSRH